MFLAEWSLVWWGGVILSVLLATVRRTRVLATYLGLALCAPVLGAAAFGALAWAVGPWVYPDPQTGGDSYGFVLAFMIVGAALIGALAGLVGGILLARRVTRKAPIF